VLKHVQVVWDPVLNDGVQKVLSSSDRWMSSPVSAFLRCELNADKPNHWFYLLGTRAPATIRSLDPVAVVLAIQNFLPFGIESDHVYLAGVAVVKQYLIQPTLPQEISGDHLVPRSAKAVVCVIQTFPPLSIESNHVGIPGVLIVKQNLVPIVVDERAGDHLAPYSAEAAVRMIEVENAVGPKTNHVCLAGGTVIEHDPLRFVCASVSDEGTGGE
jgi:hypothetical protein